MVDYPAGVYTLEITGTVGIKAVSFTVEFELVDPCPFAAITLLSSQIVDDTYTLREPAQS